jgi:hypothetical protein
MSDPVADALLFDEIARAYAQHLPELEAARARFVTRCAKIIETLVPLLDRHVRDAGLEVEHSTHKPSSDVGPYCNVFVRRSYSKGSGRKLASGISVGLAYGDFWGDGAEVTFGLYPYISFTASRLTALARRARASLAEVCPSAREVRSGYGGLYLVGAPVPFGDDFLTPQDAMRAFDAMISDFPIADDWMARVGTDVK